MWMDTFEVSQNDIGVERVPVLRSRVLHNRLRNRFLVVADEVLAATRAHLLVRHPLIMASVGARHAT